MSQKTVLIVDDDGDTLRGLSMRMRASGYDTAYACDAISAVSVALRKRPDVILLDLGLPAGDGFLVMDRLRANAALACIPVIVVSARDPKLNEERALQSGAVAYFQKPADNLELLEAIQQSIASPDAPAPGA